MVLNLRQGHFFLLSTLTTFIPFSLVIANQIFRVHLFQIAHFNLFVIGDSECTADGWFSIHPLRFDFAVHPPRAISVTDALLEYHVSGNYIKS